MTGNSRSIVNLEEMAGSLPAQDKALFQRIYAVNTTIGEQRFPQSMQPWVEQQFGSVEAVTRQKIVRVTNLVTSEETIFNRLRASRPIPVSDEKGIDAQLEELSQNDPFRYPEDNTPEDLFGRVVGKHCVTASNVAKFDGLHSLVIFNEFNPLRFSREQVVDYFDVAWEWAKRAHAMKPEAKYFFLIWNCLWRAAASINHGHAQIMLATERHYARIDRLRHIALVYKQDYGSNYFADLFQVHRSLGCAIEKDGVRILANLTPFKNNEVVLLSEGLNLSLKERIYEVMSCYRDRVGVTSFNFSMITPPLGETKESWSGFPVLVRVVDRGNINERASDIGGMTIYAAGVVNSDPFELAQQLGQCLNQKVETGDG